MNEIKQTENENFSKKDFLLLLRESLHLDDDLVSDQELLTMSMSELYVKPLDYMHILNDVEVAMSRRFYLEEEEEFKSFQDMWDYVSSQAIHK